MYNLRGIKLSTPAISQDQNVFEHTWDNLKNKCLSHIPAPLSFQDLLAQANFLGGWNFKWLGVYFMTNSFSKNKKLFIYHYYVFKLFPLNLLIIFQKTLEREIRSCDVLVIWTDCDREGENIGFEIIKVCREVKRNIQIYR